MILLIPTTVTGRPFFFNLIFTEIGIPGPFFTLGFSYFFIGWFIHRNIRILESLAHSWKKYLSLGVGCFVLLMFILSGLDESNVMDEETRGLLWINGLIVSAASTFCIIMGFMGGSEAIFRTSNKLILYFVDASYWIYLMHLIVVMSLGVIILKETSLHPIYGASLNILATTIICTATYHIFVRYTPIGWVLHGSKKSKPKAPVPITPDQP